MSLFGSSPDEPAPIESTSRSRGSLFDDEPSSASASKSSLFADDDATGAWGMPTPKKAVKGELIKSLLEGSDIPDSYIDAFDSVLKADGIGGKINADGIAKVLSASKLDTDAQSRIMTLISTSGKPTNLSRDEFNVLLALIGLAQEQEDITLDGVDERRRNLPEPKLQGLSNPPITFPDASELAAKPPQRVAIPSAAPASFEPAKPRTMRKSSIEFPEADPWGSPALHRGHNHDASPPKPNGGAIPASNEPHEPVRTTSDITTASAQPTSRTSGQPPAEIPSTPGAGGWGAYDGPAEAPFNSPGDSSIGGSFGGPSGGGDRPTQNAPSRSFGGGRVTGAGIEENIIITLLPEKEGIFMFQHHNYQVASPRRGSKVVRRYSDFVWLLDCLHKRYPFRQLPLLPPKRVGVNGNHLAADNTFIEKRRRGLARFANALVRHPVLSQEQLVIMFLTVPTELAVWRKQATISVQEEFAGKSLPPGLEDSLPPTLNELFDTTRTGVRRSADIYINLCNLVDRLAKRNEGLAADKLRLSISLQSLTDVSQDTYATDTNDVPLLNEGLQSMAKHLSNSQSLLEDEARAWDQGVLEDLKRQRDTLVSMRDMFDRRDRYDKDNIPYLERRIQNNENKLVAIRAKPDELVKPGEVEKVTEAIIKDKQSIVAQHARGVFAKECIRDELIYFQASQYHVSRLHQDWAQERVKYSELQADNWKQLQEELETVISVSKSVTAEPLLRRDPPASLLSNPNLSSTKGGGYVRIAIMPPMTSTQRSLVSQFMSITGVPEKTAQKLLKASGWKIDQASDSYFASSGTAPIEKGKDALEKLFESYRGKLYYSKPHLHGFDVLAEKSDEPNTLSVNGTMKYLQDVGASLENASMFVPLEIIQAPSLGEVSKEAFVEGWKNLGADTLSKQRALVLKQINELSTDMALFKKVYRHVFVCAREKGQKALPLDNAITYWEILFAAPGKPWVTASTNWIALWIEFLNAKWTKSVNKDMWNQTFEFFQKSMQDESLSFWSEDGAWPGVIDEFVAYAKEKKGGAERMETD
ncbi:hypothetical protein G7Y89_g5299 [Cudoniella acicularis]|uniref:Sorting nexin MVP1 n=1 Tax=Cudoniella acicularis TaxID=354080 RepID=A0A8H4RQX1_9HELO|nr:hypothetical protein G7Y89_g5299 [Cudoniella acicularis]